MSTEKETGLYVLRLYDFLDGWIDVTGPLSKEEVEARWQEETKNGTRMASYGDGDYFKVFPAGTQMLHTPEFRGR